MPVYSACGALLVGGEQHHAGQQRRGRGAVVDRGDLAPPVPGARVGGRVVAARVDALAVPARAEAGVQVDPAEAAAARAVLAQHLAQRLLAPGRRDAAVEQALRVVVLAAGNAPAAGLRAVLGDEPRGRIDRRRIGRPGSRHEQRGELVVGGVARRLGGEVAEVAVQVDVLVRGPPPPGEAVGIERVDVEHGDAGVVSGPVPVGVLEQRDLHAGAAEALDAMAGAADTSSAGRSSARRGRRPSPASRRRVRASDGRASRHRDRAPVSRR